MIMIIIIIFNLLYSHARQQQISMIIQDFGGSYMLVGIK